MSSPYPSRQKISEIIGSLAQGKHADFFAHVANDVDWIILGHHPLAGRYHGITEFQEQILGRLNAIMKNPLQLKVRSVIGGGDEEWAVVELIFDSTCKNGEEECFFTANGG
jgi:ketosteroid isomerase-like protein